MSENHCTFATYFIAELYTISTRVQKVWNTHKYTQKGVYRALFSDVLKA